MNLIWQKVAFIACLGFTALMAGANLAHMTATANGAPVPLLGFEIPHKTIMAVGAVCVDVIIIISPFALRYRHVNGQHTAFFVVLALWLGCSLVSIQSVHDWLAESAQATAAPAVSAERQYHDLKTTLDESRVRLKSIKEKLLKEEDYGKRRILLNEEKRQKDDIDVMEKKFWQAQVVPMPKPDDMEHWVKAVILWALSVGCWVGFLGDGEVSRETDDARQRRRPIPRSYHGETLDETVETPRETLLSRRETGETVRETRQRHDVPRETVLVETPPSPMEMLFPNRRDSETVGETVGETLCETGETDETVSETGRVRHLSLAVDNVSLPDERLRIKIIKMKEEKISVRKIAQLLGVSKHTVEHALGMKQKRPDKKLGSMIGNFRKTFSNRKRDE